MKIVPVKGYTVPYPGKASKRKKTALRVAALLTATLAAAGGAGCRTMGEPVLAGDPVPDDSFFCSPEATDIMLPGDPPMLEGESPIDDSGAICVPDPTEEVLLVGDILVPTPTPRPKAKATPSPKPTEEELFWAGVPPLLEGDVPIDGD